VTLASAVVLLELLEFLHLFCADGRVEESADAGATANA